MKKAATKERTKASGTPANAPSGTSRESGQAQGSRRHLGSCILRCEAAQVARPEMVSTGAGAYFDPGHGRLMKEWVAVADATAPWVALAREATPSSKGAATAGLGLCAVPCLLGDPEKTLARVTSLGFSRCVLFLVTHTATSKTPRVRAVTEFLGRLLSENRAAIEG